jgi:hypothetical protein
MGDYAIIETDDGFTVVELRPGEAAEEAASGQRGYVVDPGPYGSYDEAYDALLALQEEEEEDQ